MEILATCEICGNKYIKRNGKSKYCSDKCKRAGRQATLKKWRDDNPDYHSKWIDEHPGYTEEWKKSHPTYYRDRSRAIRNNIEYVRKCIVCGREFKTYRHRKWTCSDGCHAINRDNRIPGDRVANPDITLKKLYERDGGVCALCGKQCDWLDRDRKKNAIGPQYPSIDHIIPLSLGGMHSWANIQLAHVGCNSAKCNKIIIKN